MSSAHCVRGWWLLGLVILTSPVVAEEPKSTVFAELEVSYPTEFQPLLKRYCVDCHAGADADGKLDLERFASLSAARQETDVWLKVAERLEHQEMPPEDADQPTGEERAAMSAWLKRYFHAEAYASAGDPGPSVLRRLNNAEYTYTVRDLTGVPLNPVKEFPADGAAGEGFTNAGAAMVMSPALVDKYFAAAKEIAAHAVLTPSGLHFSESTTSSDWTNETLARIREIYRRHTDAAGASQVNLQGIVFDTNDGGRLPIEKYLAATLTDRAALEGGGKSIEAVANEHGLNAKYLGILWNALHDEQPSLLLDGVRARWRASRAEDATSIAQGIAAWQQSLWRFTSVGHIGKVGGPTAWQEPVAPLVARQEVKFAIPFAEGQEEVTLYLVVGDAGDGPEHDVVLWERPRLVAPERAEVLLRDVRAQAPDMGLDPALFGVRPDGAAIDAGNLCLQAPAMLEIKLPRAMAQGAELVASVGLAPEVGAEGSVQIQVLTTKPSGGAALQPSGATTVSTAGAWTAETEHLVHATPILVQDNSEAKKRFEAAFTDFRALFPAALCYTKIVPVDEVVTLTLFHREDEPLERLMLSDAETHELDRLWAELRFVSQDALRLVDGFEQLMEFATQDADPSVFAPLRGPINERAEKFRQTLLDAEPRHVEALIEFAALAYRRPLAAGEADELRGLYQRLRTDELPHDEAIRLTLARVLVAPAFLYRLEDGGRNGAPADARWREVNDWELATRLSYFLWSGPPDAELRALAASGALHDRETLNAQMRRMLRDPKIERLAREFGCQWLHVYEFDTLDEKSERHFPEFAALRGDMYAEAIRFTTDAFQQDASIGNFFDADHTFVDARLAAFYGMTPPGDPLAEGEWRRVEGLRAAGRGGVLGFAATLAKQSGASRTSPILRGNWVSEVLLGEKLPKPPPGVPVLPEDEFATAELTVRQLVEKHTSDAKCAKCHRRIDPLGFSLEEFDAIGRRREQDLAGRAIDAATTLPDGTAVVGLNGLREYLVTHRREALLRQFCRKLVGYATGRSVRLSDQPLIDEMMRRLAEKEDRISVAVETIVESNQFRAVRVE